MMRQARGARAMPGRRRAIRPGQSLQGLAHPQSRPPAQEI
jgi:hypothetical protein